MRCHLTSCLEETARQWWTIHYTPHQYTVLAFLFVKHHHTYKLYSISSFYAIHTYIHTHALQQLQQHLAALLTVNYLFSSCTFSCCHYSALYFPPCSLFFIFTALLAGYLISSSHIPVVVARNSGRLRFKRYY